MRSMAMSSAASARLVRSIAPRAAFRPSAPITLRSPFAPRHAACRMPCSSPIAAAPRFNRHRVVFKVATSGERAMSSSVRSPQSRTASRIVADFAPRQVVTIVSSTASIAGEGMNRFMLERNPRGRAAGVIQPSIEAATALCVPHVSVISFHEMGGVSDPLVLSGRKTPGRRAHEALVEFERQSRNACSRPCVRASSSIISQRRHRPRFAVRCRWRTRSTVDVSSARKGAIPRGLRRGRRSSGASSVRRVPCSRARMAFRRRAALRFRWT